jgi:DNA-binding transcriptional ArsR family regulator
MAGGEAVSVIRDAEQAAALLQPERRRLLEALVEPDSAAGLARRFDLPRQRLNYHLKELERVGLVHFVEERRKGNCVERVVRATARAYAISPEVMGPLGLAAHATADRLSASYLVALASRAIREIGDLIARGSAARKRVATLAIDTEVRFRSAEARAVFTDELTAALSRVVTRHHDVSAPSGRAFRLVVAAYPKPLLPIAKEPS